MAREIVRAMAKDICDHKNGNGLDNRRCNLRLCNAGENARNRPNVLSIKGKRVSSKYKGVYRNQGKWQTNITFEGKRWSLGRFDNEMDAAQQYNIAAQLLYGDFCYLNDI